MRIWIACTLFLLALCPLLSADPPNTALRIEVKTLKERPIERASVVLDFLGDRKVFKLGRKARTHWETRTNQEGVAKLPPVPQGKIRVMIIAKGYQTFGQDYELNEEEKTIEIKMNPPQSQYSVHQ